MRLSDAYMAPVRSGEYEWTVTAININHGNNVDLLEKCQPLLEYSRFVDITRKAFSILPANASNNAMIQAAKGAVKHCIETNVLRDFLPKHLGEVEDMILTEYSAELHIKALEKSAHEEGREEMRDEMFLRMVKDPNIPWETAISIAKISEQHAKELLSKENS